MDELVVDWADSGATAIISALHFFISHIESILNRGTKPVAFMSGNPTSKLSREIWIKPGIKLEPERGEMYLNRLTEPNVGSIVRLDWSKYFIFRQIF